MTDVMSLIDDDTLQKMEMEWSNEHEKILIDWADKAMCYRWLHSQANIKYSYWTKAFTIPVIIISTITGTANFAQDRVPLEYVAVFVMLVGSLNILAGIITTVQQFLKVNELNEAHRVSSIAWDKFYRNIKIEIAKKPKERMPIFQMLKICKEEFDRLMETSPVIGNDIIDRFNNTFKDAANFQTISKPEICDELVSTNAFRFIEDAQQVANSKMSEVVRKSREFEQLKKRVKQFITKFNETQERMPLDDELEESMFEKELAKTDEEKNKIRRAIRFVREEEKQNVKVSTSNDDVSVYIS